MTENEIHIVIVSRNVVVREGLSTMLARNGWRIETREPGTRAAEPVAGRVDLVILDTGDCGCRETNSASPRPAPLAGAPFIRYAHCGYAAGDQERAGLTGLLTRKEIVRRVMAALQPTCETAVHLPSTRLSERERSIFKLLGSGRANAHIAKELGVSVKTVETHKENMKHKLLLADNEALRMAAIRACSGNTQR